MRFFFFFFFFFFQVGLQKSKARFSPAGHVIVQNLLADKILLRAVTPCTHTYIHTYVHPGSNICFVLQ